MTVILKNNAFGFIAAALSNSDTAVVLQSGYGANFPSLSASEYFYATISPTSGASEIVKVTARSGDTLTVVRAQEGTSALSFAAGSRIELRVTAQSVIDAIADRVSQVDQASEITIADAGNYYTSGNVEGALQEAALATTTRFVQAGTGATTRSVQAKLRDWVSVLDFGADPTGVADSTTAIQSAINSVTKGTVLFPAGTYRTTADITLKSGVNLLGQNATITYTASWATYGSFFKTVPGGGIADVEITGFVFDGKGTWTATPFANPYGGGNSVGFTNNHVAMTIANNSSNVTIRDNVFKNIGRPIIIGWGYGFIINNNEFVNNGVHALNCQASDFVTFNNNIVLGVLGNLTDPGDTNIANSKFADGCYVNDVWDCTISNNIFENIIRIGVVLEGDAGGRKNKRVSVVGNTFKLMQKCRGTEYNAAIWSEVGKSEYSCVVSGNTMDNGGATPGTLSSIGILAEYLTITGNYIRKFDTGIQGTEFKAVGNTIEYCDLGAFSSGIAIANQAVGKTTEVIGNCIQYNGSQGIEVYQSKGTIVIKGNTFKDNGTQATGLERKSGVMINGYYNDQQLSISNNVFVSSANQGATSGQLCGIVGIAGGDFNYDAGKTITGNDFRFTGTFTDVYPNNLQQYPVSFMFWNTAPGGYFGYEVAPDNNFGNTNDKFKQSNWQNFYAGSPLSIGYASAAPVAGAHRQGDIVYNNSIAANGFLGWVCTTAGTPGTWYEFGHLRNSNAYTVANPTTDRALDVTGDTLAQVAAVLGTLIADLKTSKIIS